jgi:hypothetical protein
MISIVITIETAFLHGDVDEEIYTEVPIGLSVGANKILILRKTIYSLMQSVWTFYKKSINALKVTALYGSKSDPVYG